MGTAEVALRQQGTLLNLDSTSCSPLIARPTTDLLDGIMHFNQVSRFEKHFWESRIYPAIKKRGSVLFWVSN